MAGVGAKVTQVTASNAHFLLVPAWFAQAFVPVTHAHQMIDAWLIE